jgi:hypothetical protein
MCLVRRPAAPLLLVALLLGRPAAFAEDAPAPSLSVSHDSGPPRPAFGVTADPVAIATGRYGVQLEALFGGAHGFWVAPAWAWGSGLSLELAYHIWPLARGLSGPFLGPLGGAVLGPSPRGWEAAWLGGEAGYQHVWSGLALGLAVGVVARWEAEGTRQRGQPAAGLRVRLALGWAWS